MLFNRKITKVASKPSSLSTKADEEENNTLNFLKKKRQKAKTEKNDCNYIRQSLQNSPDSYNNMQIFNPNQLNVLKAYIQGEKYLYNLTDLLEIFKFFTGICYDKNYLKVVIYKIKGG